MTDERSRRIFLEITGLKVVDEEICKVCKGRNCCQHFPCFYATSDFKVLRERENYTDEQRLEFLLEFIKLGKTSIDMFWAKDMDYGPLNPKTMLPDLEKIKRGDGFLFLRARIKDHPIVDFQYFLDADYDWPCINWSLEKGCNLSTEERPFTGVWLLPNDCGPCVEAYNEAEFCYGWSTYRELMYELYQKARWLKL